MLLERWPLTGIVRVTGVSKRWLQYYVKAQYDQTPRKIVVSNKSKGRLTIEGDELESFASTQKNQPWVWLALNRKTREIVSVARGARSSQTARSLWNSLPSVYRQGAVSYTDFWLAYSSIFPTTRHRALGKKSGQTNQIERCNYLIEKAYHYLLHGDKLMLPPRWRFWTRQLF